MGKVASVGIFIDADNLLPFWLGGRSAVQCPRERSHYIKAIDFKAVLEQVDSLVAPEGSVVFREAYGHWANSARSIPASMMYHEFGYDLQHVPPLSREINVANRTIGGKRDEGLKNAGDILLSVRAIRAATERLGLDTIIVGAADKDYHQLVTELKRLGKKVVCLAFPQSGQQGKLLLETFDEVLILSPVARWIELKKAQISSNQAAGKHGSQVIRCAPEALTPVSPLAAVERPQEPSKPTKIPDAHVLAREIWEQLETGALSTERLLAIAVVDHEVSQAEARGMLSRLLERGQLLEEETSVRAPANSGLTAWKRNFVVALIDTMVDDLFDESAETAIGLTAQLHMVREQAAARFRVVTPGITAPIGEAVGRRTSGLTAGTPRKSD